MLPQEQIQYLADAGYVVVSADYRLCPQVSLYEGPIEDAKDAYRWWWCKSHLPGLLKQDAGLDVDGSRIAVFGHSAGGCLALHLVSWDFAPARTVILQPLLYRARFQIHHLQFSTFMV